MFFSKNSAARCLGALLLTFFILTAAGCSRFPAFASALPAAPPPPFADSPPSVAANAVFGLPLLCASLRPLPSPVHEAVYLRILANPYLFFHWMHLLSTQPHPALDAVDKTHPLSHAETFLPPSLAAVEDAGVAVTRPNLLLTRETIHALSRLHSMAETAGLRLTVGSAYRSHAYQSQTYRGWVSLLGREAADRLSAKPGTSQHQLGTTVDFFPIDIAFSRCPESDWLALHAWEAGFSLSYPKGAEAVTGYAWEPWHYRYLGNAMVNLQRSFFGNSQYYLLKWWNAFQNDGKECPFLLQ